MATSQPQATGFAPIAKLRLLLDAIRFEHTIFALPFAYLGRVLAAGGLFRARRNMDGMGNPLVSRDDEAAAP